MLGRIGEIKRIVVVTSREGSLLLVMAVEDMADGGEAEGSVRDIVEIGEEGLVEDQLRDCQVVLMSRYLMIEFVLGLECVSALVPGDIVVANAWLDRGDVSPGGNSIADLLVVNHKVCDLNDGVDLFWLLLGADNVLRGDIFLDIVGQGQVDTRELDTDGLSCPFSWLESEDVFNSLTVEVLSEGGLGQNKDGVLFLVFGFKRQSNGVEHGVLINVECSDNLEAVNVHGSDRSLELSLANGQEFVFPVVGVVMGVENDGLGGVSVQGWHIWHESINDLIVGCNTDMRVD